MGHNPSSSDDWLRRVMDEAKRLRNDPNRNTDGPRPVPSEGFKRLMDEMEAVLSKLPRNETKRWHEHLLSEMRTPEGREGLLRGALREAFSGQSAESNEAVLRIFGLSPERARAVVQQGEAAVVEEALRLRKAKQTEIDEEDSTS